MGFYFEDHDSMHARVGMQVEDTLAAVARRFVGQNPPHPLTYRAYSKRGILRDKEYRYEVDFNRFFPDAVNEQYVYAWSKYWATAPGELKFDVTCYGPIVIYCNGQVVFKSNIFSERYSDQRNSILIPLLPGWNHLVVRCKKTRAGFGGIENGLHQRLDVSHNDDRCRIRHDCGMFVAGLLRRISNSLFMEWRSDQPHPEHLTTTDFQAAMGEDHCRPAMRLLLAKRPSLKPP